MLSRLWRCLADCADVELKKDGELVMKMLGDEACELTQIFYGRCVAQWLACLTNLNKSQVRFTTRHPKNQVNRQLIRRLHLNTWRTDSEAATEKNTPS